VVTTRVKYAAYETYIAGHCVRRHTKSVREVPGLLLFVLGHGDGVHIIWDSEFFQKNAGFPTIWCPGCVQRETCFGRHAARTRASPDSSSGQTGQKTCSGVSSG